MTDGVNLGFDIFRWMLVMGGIVWMSVAKPAQ